MRPLTLHEKITIKGLLLRHGLALPALTMADALHYWRMVYGRSIAEHFKIQYRRGKL